MARDYKKRTRSKPQPSGGLSTVVTFTAGLSIGLFVAFLVYIEHKPNNSVLSSSEPPAKVVKKQATISSDEAQVTQKPTFDFYDLLPEMEVEVPSIPENARARGGGSKDQYLLQIASFRKQADAERLKAQLAFIGLEADIQLIHLSGGETWHRVKIGPFNSLRTMDKVTRQLQENGFDSLKLKVPS